MKNIQELNKIIRQLLKELGCSANLLGYEYLVSALFLCATSSKNILPMGTIYDDVAKKCDTTYSKAERSIRHAIETSILKANPDKFNEVFGWTVDSNKGKPTNSEYIFTVADYIKNFY